MQVKRLNPMRRFFAIRGMASAMIAFAALIVISVVAGLLYALVEIAAKRVWWRGF